MKSAALPRRPSVNQQPMKINNKMLVTETNWTFLAELTGGRQNKPDYVVAVK